MTKPTTKMANILASTSRPVDATTERVFIGLDVGDRTSHCFAITFGGEVLTDRSFPTSPESIDQFFKPLAGADILIEVGSQSRWMSRQLRNLGLKVTVCEARKAAEANKHKRKNDRIDAKNLALMLRSDSPHITKVEHRSEPDHAVWVRVQSRRALIEVRTKLINSIRGVAKSFGHKLPRCSSSSFNAKTWMHDPVISGLLDHTYEVLAMTNAKIAALDREFEKLAESKPEAQLLMGIPGVAALTALTYLSVIGDIKRFKTNRNVGAYVGLVTKERSSGDSQPQLAISKRGNTYLRTLLVTAAHYTIGPMNKTDSDLRRWGLAHAGDGGNSNRTKRAVVAVARKLAVVMAAMLRTRKAYVPLRERPAEAAA